MLLLAAAKGAIEPTTERPLPTLLHEARVVRSQPFVRISELLAVLIGGNSGHRRYTRGGSAGLGLPLHELEFVHELGVTDDRVDGGQGKILMLGRELREKVLIARVHATEEEHHLEDGRDSHRRTRERTHVPLKPRPKLVDAFLVTLCVVEQSKKGSERIGNRRRTKMVLQNLEHLKPFAVES